MEEINEAFCPICNKAITLNDDINILTETGVETIVHSCSLRNVQPVAAFVGGKVHSVCRCDFTNSKAIAKKRRSVETEQDESHRKSYRRGHTSIPRKTKCLYCNLDIEASSTSQKSHSVEFDKFITEILNCCSKRKDYWSHHVKSTIEYYQRDLFAFDVDYHDQCDINFRTGKNIPLKFRDRVNPDLLNPLLKRGRLEHASLKNAFLRTCEFMEGNEE